MNSQSTSIERSQPPKPARRGRPPKPAKINTAIVAIMREIGAIGKECENKDQKYDYRSIVQIYNRIQPLMAKHGVFTRPELLDHHRDIRESKAGRPISYVTARVRYEIMAEDGSSIDVIVAGEAMDASDKATNKAMTAAHKYALCQLFNIPYEVIDPDAFTPQWAEEFTGRVTLKTVNDVKGKWMQFARVGTVDDTNRDDVASDFASWVRSITGRQFDPLDFRKWQLSDAQECEAAMNNHDNGDGGSD